MAAKSTPPFGPKWQLLSLILRGRYSENVAQHAIRLINDTMRMVHAEIAAAPDAALASVYQRQQLLAVLQQMLSEAYGRAGDTVRNMLDSYAVAETEVIRASLRRAGLEMSFGLPSRSQLLAAADLDSVLKGLTGKQFGDWWQTELTTTLRRIQSTIQTRFLMGDGPAAIARYIWNKNPRERTVATSTYANIRMLARTSVTAIQTRASVNEMAAHGIVQRVRFEAILDQRTSVICAALDGGVYDLDAEDLPVPPLHPNCRSALVPVIDGALGEALDSRSRTSRQSYDAWLKAQDESTQNAVLGKGKAEMYRRGAVTLSDLISHDRSTVTLSELKRRLMP